MNIEAVQELQEIRFKLAIVEQQMLEAARMVPELQELLGPAFYELEPDDNLGEYLRKIRLKTDRLQAALLNFQFFEEHSWGEAMLKLLSTPRNQRSS